jgi:ATP-binding cassette subfamily B protein
VAGVALRLAEPWPLKLVLDHVLLGGAAAAVTPYGFLGSLSPLALLTVCAIGVVALSGLRALADYHQRLGLVKVGNRVLRHVRNHVFVHVQSLSLSFHDRSRSGDLIVRVTRDVSLIRDVSATAIFPMFASVLILVGMFSVMLLLQWKLALLAMATVPLFWVSALRIGRGIRVAARKQRKREGAMAATAAESITAIREVQALGIGESFADNFAGSNRESQKEDLKAARLSAKLGRTVDVLTALATALVLWYGALLVLRGTLTAGDLVVFLSYLRRGFRPAKDFAKYSGRLAKATAAGERVLALLGRMPEVQERPDALVPARLEGAIRFEGVSFEYEPGRPALRDVGLRIEPGQFVALTGPSGSGKSTLTSLLLRLYDPDRGRVCLDGEDLRDYALGPVRSQISVVLQDALLFSGTVAENIACGNGEVDAERIEAAPRLARADGFIRRLPDGYDTLVGERGVTLSRGQRQRLSIARAALRGAPLLVLDEPTTGLDERNERAVASAIVRLSRSATTILVTHDVALTRLADLVVYLEDGRVVEQGSPGELLAARGRYAELCRMRSDRSERLESCSGGT